MASALMPSQTKTESRAPAPPSVFCFYYIYVSPPNNRRDFNQSSESPPPRRGRPARKEQTFRKESSRRQCHRPRPRGFPVTAAPSAECHQDTGGTASRHRRGAFIPSSESPPLRRGRPPPERNSPQADNARPLSVAPPRPSWHRKGAMTQRKSSVPVFPA